MTATHARPAWFRQHTSAKAMTSPLLRQLCEEWSALNADPAIADAVERWSQEHAALHGCTTPGDVIDLIDAQPSDDQDQILLTLMALLRGGEQLAGRVLLQAMLPAITGVARRTTPPKGCTSHEEHLHVAITQFWLVISRPNPLTCRRVAARLKLDTLHHLTKHLHRGADAWEAHTRLEPEPERTADAHTATPLSGPSPEDDIYDLIVSARETGIITASDAQFLADVFLAPENEMALSHAARRLAIQPDAVRQRCGRIRDRIVNATLDDHHRRGRIPRRAHAS